jgi:hypothetical protein
VTIGVVTWKYESQGKTVEAGAWRDKLQKDCPKFFLEPVPDK